MLFALVILPASAGAGGKRPVDQQRVAQLERRLAILQAQEARHARNEFMGLSEQHAAELENAAVQDVRNANLVDAAKTLAGTAIDSLAKSGAAALIAKQAPQVSGDRAAFSAKTLENTFKAPWTIGNAGYTLYEKTNAVDARGASALDARIARLEQVRAGSDLAATADVTGYTSTYTKAVGIVPSVLLVQAYLQRADAASTEAERQKFRDKAVSMAYDTVWSAAKLGGATVRAEVKLGKTDADLVARLSTFAATEYEVHGERAFAEQVRGDALNYLQYEVMRTQYELDRAQGHTFNPSSYDNGQPFTGEPGGIKIGDVTADALAARLDLTSVGYDPLHRRLILAGRRATRTIDLALFRDVLRLAVEHHDPFFSLNPVAPKDWDRQPEVGGALLRTKLLAGDDSVFVARLRANGLRIPLHDGRECYYDTLRGLDRDLEGALEQRLDTRVERVYSPAWLAQSEVGRVLYEADLAIKAVTSGVLVDARSTAAVAPVWNIDGFTPLWDQPWDRADRQAGRANFELNSATLRDDGAVVDLAQVRPKLVIVRRETGTSHDLPPAPLDRRTAAQFDRRWQSYVAHVPVLGELTNVFRAYVAARYIVRNHPALARALLAAPPPLGATGIHLYDARSPSVIACAAGTHLVPLSKDRAFYVGAGFGGGISMHVGPDRVQVVIAPPAPADAFAHRAAAGDASFTADGDARAIVLDVVPTTSLSPAAQLAIAAAFEGVAVGLVVLLPLAGRRSAPHDALPASCEHCARVHRGTERVGRFCDALALGAFAFIVALPLIAAAHEQLPNLAQGLVALAAIATVLAFPALVALAARGILFALRRWHGAWSGGLLRVVGSGARWFGLVLALVLLSGGLTPDALAARVLALTGPQIGERLWTDLGSALALELVVLVLVVTALGAFVARWVAPRYFDTRPLPLGSPHQPHGAPA